MYDLSVLFEDNRIKIRRCLRCDGLLYRPFKTREEKDFYKDKVKCFSCSRVFCLRGNRSSAVWRQWPDRDEDYERVHEVL